MRLHAFRALRPAPARAARISCPPYDVMSTAEARAMAEGNPDSFLHVIRPEIGLPGEVDSHDDRVYAAAAENLRRLRGSGALIADEEPAIWLYRLIMDGRAQVGFVGCAEVADYRAGLIKRHEHTRKDKEDDRARHVDTTGANTGPVFLTCRARRALELIQDHLVAQEPTVDFMASDDVRHTLWGIFDPGRIADIQDAFAEVDAFYIADGHHRAASAARARDLRRERHPDAPEDAEFERFLVVVFPHDQLRIMDYNRVVADLNGLDEGGFLGRVEELFEVSEPGTDARPAGPRSFGCYLGGAWRQLTARPEIIDPDDPVARLDVAILQRHLLSPILGIGDPRTDPRIDFVGGIRGTGELERRVRANGGGVAFAMYPTAIEELLAVADAGLVMPPKSTWFEPKLRSGLLVHPLD